MTRHDDVQTQDVGLILYTYNINRSIMTRRNFTKSYNFFMHILSFVNITSRDVFIEIIVRLDYFSFTQQKKDINKRKIKKKKKCMGYYNIMSV